MVSNILCFIFLPDYDKHLFVTWVETTTKVLQFAPETFMGLKDPPKKNNRDSNGKYTPSGVLRHQMENPFKMYFLLEKGEFS